MTRLLASAIAIALAFPLPAAAQDFSVERIGQHIRTLSDDWFEGRAPGTPGEDKTVAYLSGAFASIGLQPGGDLRSDGSRAWTQDVILNRSTMVDAPQLSIDIGGERVAMVQDQDLAVRSPVNGMTEVRLKDVPLLFVGYGAHAPERDWSDFKDVDVAGKVIVALVNDPDFEGGEGDFGGEAMTYYGRWTYKYEEAARRGGRAGHPRDQAGQLPLGRHRQRQRCDFGYRPQGSRGGAFGGAGLDACRYRQPDLRGGRHEL